MIFSLFFALVANAQKLEKLPYSGPWDEGPSYGIHWSLNASSTGAYIIDVTTTLEVPGPVLQESVGSGALGFYPALTNQNEEIVQSIVATFAEAEPSQLPCVGNGSTYCVLLYFDSPSLTVGKSDGRHAVVHGGDQVTINYQMDEQVKFYKQSIYTNGKPVLSGSLKQKDSGLSLSAPLIEWGPRIECVNGFTGTSPPHTYRNTTISLSQSAPNFPKSLITLNSTNSRIDSADGGQTWTVDTIHIKESRCT